MNLVNNKGAMMKILGWIIGGVAAIALFGCETPTTQRYSISADNNQAIKSLRTSAVGIGAFAGPSDFNANCRALGPLQVADGLSHTQYIQKAFEDELKIAGVFAQTAPRVTLAGKVERLEFSSMRALTGGSWTIELALKSSNGKSLLVNEYYEFSSGFAAPEACRNTAEAFSRAVQDLVGKAVRDPGFASLLNTTTVTTPTLNLASIQPVDATMRPTAAAVSATIEPASLAHAPPPVSTETIKGGRDPFNAERLAETRSCNVQPTAALIAKGPGFETYSVACSNGDALTVRCEDDAVRVRELPRASVSDGALTR